MANLNAKATGGTLILTKGNDTIKLGKGVDVIRTGLNNGTNNVVTGYDSNKDILEIAKGINPNEKGVKGYSFEGNDLIMRLGQTKIRLKNMAGKAVRFRAQGSSKAEPINFYQALPKNTSYAKNDWTKIVAGANFSGTFDMHEYNENLKTFDARNARRAVNVTGSARDEVIYASNYGGTINAGKGNDTIHLGKGTDVIRANTTDGNDTVYNYESGKDILEIAKGIDPKAHGVRGYSLVDNDLVVRLGKTNITLKGMATKTIKARLQGKSGIEENNFFTAISKENGNKVHYAKSGSAYDWTKAVADSTFSGKFKMDEYNENLKTFDGRNVKKYITVHGNNGSNVIYAGNKGSYMWGADGNDTLYCGNGADIIYYNNDDNNDTIVNFNAKQDVVKVSADCGDIKGVTVDGKDLVVTIGQNKWHADHGNGSLRFKNGATMGGIRIQGARAAQSRTQAQVASYNSGTKTLTALTTNVGGTYNLGSFAANGVTLNAGKLKAKATLIGNAQGNKITAGQAGSEIRAGKGNDTITCGAGKDRIWFAKGEGKDTVLKSGKNDVAYLYGVKDIHQVTNKLAKGVMTLGIKGSADCLSISGWKAGSSLATVELANGKKYTFGAKNGDFKLTK